MKDREVSPGFKGVGQVLALGLVRFLSSGLIAAVYAVPVMWALAILHEQWHQVPAIGYLGSVVLLWAWRLLTPYTVKAKAPE